MVFAGEIIKYFQGKVKEDPIVAHAAAFYFTDIIQQNRRTDKASPSSRHRSSQGHFTRLFVEPTAFSVVGSYDCRFI